MQLAGEHQVGLAIDDQLYGVAAFFQVRQLRASLRRGCGAAPRDA